MSAKLRYRLTSVDDRDTVRLATFADLTDRIAALLRELDRSGTADESVDWVIVDLSIGSATVEVEGRPSNPVADISPLIVQQAIETLESAARGARLPDVPTAAWLQARAVADLLQANDVRLNLKANGREVDLDRWQMPLAAVPEIETRRRVSEAVTSVEGSLDTVFLHDPRDAHFVIWDAVYGRQVRCDFAPEHLRIVKEALGERVRVNGRVQFDAIGRPERIVEIFSIRVLRPGSGPAPSDLRGMAPDITGGLDSVEWVRRIRDAEG